MTTALKARQVGWCDHQQQLFVKHPSPPLYWARAVPVLFCGVSFHVTTMMVIGDDGNDARCIKHKTNLLQQLTIDMRQL